MKLLSHNAQELCKILEAYLASDTNYKSVFVHTKRSFEETPSLTAHNWAHTYRDIINAIVIGEAEKADMSIVMPAITMHDIGFLYGAEGKTHGAVGAEKVSEFLKAADAQYSQTQINAIADCIRTHKGSIHGENPRSLEAKVVADADLLEKFGPFGIYQTIRTYAEFNWPIDKALQRGKDILKLRVETQTGNLLCQPGRQYVANFYEQLADANQPYEGYGVNI